MSITHQNILTYDLFYLYPDSTTSIYCSDNRRHSELGYGIGKEELIGRFSISREEENNLLKKYNLPANYSLWSAGYYSENAYGLVLKVFEKFFNFDKGTNGFQCRWLRDKVFDEGFIYWNVDHWKLIRIK